MEQKRQLSKSWGRMRQEYSLPGSLWRPVAIEVGIKRRCGDAQPFGDVAGIGLRIRQSSHCHRQHCTVHLAMPPSLASTRSGGSQSCAGTFRDQLSFSRTKLCQIGVHFTWKIAYLPRRARCARKGRCDGLANFLHSVWTAWPPLDFTPRFGRLSAGAFCRNPSQPRQVIAVPRVFD